MPRTITRPVSAVNGLSDRQREAIREALRTFVDEDLASGVPPERQIACDGCRQLRPAAGFVEYGTARLCNECAAEYETQRACDALLTIRDFLTKRQRGLAGAPVS